MSGATPGALSVDDVRRRSSGASAGRIAELSLPSSARSTRNAFAGGDVYPEIKPTSPTLSPRTALENAAKVRSLEEKVRMLEAQLSQASPKPTGRSGITRLLLSSRLTTTPSDGGSSVLTPNGLHGSCSPIPDDVPEDMLEFVGDETGDRSARAGAGGEDFDESRSVPEELESPALDASLTGSPSVTFAAGVVEDVSQPAGPRRPMTSDQRLLTADQLFIMKVTANMDKVVAGRKPLVLVSTGAYNPIHLQHARMFYLARKYLIERTEYQVVGGVLSPSHDAYVRGQCRRFPSHAIPPKHRMAMSELAVADSSWLCVLRWEATRRTVMDYRSVLKHVKQLLDAAFPASKSPHVMYLCGADHLLVCGPQTIKDFGCICCSRPGFTEELEKAIGKKYRRLVHIVDDDALLTLSLDSVSSTKVRKRMAAGQDTSDLVGEAVARYIAENRLAEKVAGTLPWTEADKEALTHDIPCVR